MRNMIIRFLAVLLCFDSYYFGSKTQTTCIPELRNAFASICDCLVCLICSVTIKKGLNINREEEGVHVGEDEDSKHYQVDV